jgi:hypothetical protein
MQWILRYCDKDCGVLKSYEERFEGVGCPRRGCQFEEV